MWDAVLPCLLLAVSPHLTSSKFSIGLDTSKTGADLAGQCRPLSKTVRFNVLRVMKNKAAAKAFNKF